jgi:hypothetical protein
MRAIETLYTRLSSSDKYSETDYRQIRVRSPSPAMRGRSPRRFPESLQNQNYSDNNWNSVHLSPIHSGRPASPKYLEQKQTSMHYQQHENNSQSRAISCSPVKGIGANED